MNVCRLNRKGKQKGRNGAMGKRRRELTGEARYWKCWWQQGRWNRERGTGLHGGRAREKFLSPGGKDHL